MKDKVNILFVCKANPSGYNEGIKMEAWNLCRSLMEMGHEVTVLSVGGSDCENSIMKEGVVLTKVPYYPGVWKYPVLNLAENYFFELTAQKWVKKNKDEFDVVHVEGRREYLVSGKHRTGSLLAILRSLPVVR